MLIWSDSVINQLAVDAEQQINKDLNGPGGAVLFKKFYLNTLSGVSVYTLPCFVRTVSRITWLGRKLDAVSWEELRLLTPATVWVNPTTFLETSQGRPLYWALHPTNPYDIRMYPTPNADFGQGPDPYAVDLGNYCIVSCWRNIDPTGLDPTALLPKYVDRRLRKAYILSRAFALEGKGQNAGAADYYSKLYDFLINRFKLINSGCYVGQQYAVDDGVLTTDNFKYPKPIMPSNFETVYFE
jgi:hypothetical protein